MVGWTGQQPSTLHSALETMLDDPEFSDFQFIAEGRTIHAHRYHSTHQCIPPTVTHPHMHLLLIQGHIGKEVGLLCYLLAQWHV